jgi:hypothetical protein
MELVAFRLWIRGHPDLEYPNLEAARKGIRERVRRDDMKPIPRRDDDQRIPF